MGGSKQGRLEKGVKKKEGTEGRKEGRKGGGKDRRMIGRELK